MSGGKFFEGSYHPSSGLVHLFCIISNSGNLFSLFQKNALESLFNKTKEVVHTAGDVIFQFVTLLPSYSLLKTIRLDVHRNIQLHCFSKTFLWNVAA